MAYIPLLMKRDLQLAKGFTGKVRRDSGMTTLGRVISMIGTRKIWKSNGYIAMNI